MRRSFGGRRRAIPGLGRCGARGRGSQATLPGGVGAPPGGTTAPCQELADAGAAPRASADTLGEKRGPAPE